MAEKHETAQVDAGIVEMWRKDGRLYFIAGILIGLMIFPLIGAINETGEVQKFLENLVPEAVGIFVTVVFIYYLDRRRDEKNAEEALKRQLVMDVRSLSRETSKQAIHQLQDKGWLKGVNGLLKGADLRNTQLEGAHLENANLERARLDGANLNGAFLNDTNLTGAVLDSASLQQANLLKADLTRAKLQKANLTNASLEGVLLNMANLEGVVLIGASLIGAELRGANLRESKLKDAQLIKADLMNADLYKAEMKVTRAQGADFTGANLERAIVEWESDSLDGAMSINDIQFDGNTILPDGQKYHYTTVLSRFTYRDYRRVWRQDDKEYKDEFWRSDDPNSPAYRGKREE